MSNFRKFAESDFVNSALLEQKNERSNIFRHSFADSSFELMQGVEITELDTIPAELLEFADSSFELMQGVEITELDTIPAELLDLIK